MYSETIENIGDECGYAIGHEAKVYKWLFEHRRDSLKNGYPVLEDILAAMDALDLLSFSDRLELELVTNPYDLVETWNERECYQYMENNGIEYPYTGCHRDSMDRAIVEYMRLVDDWEGKPTP